MVNLKQVLNQTFSKHFPLSHLISKYKIRCLLVLYKRVKKRSTLMEKYFMYHKAQSFKFEERRGGGGGAGKYKVGVCPLCNIYIGNTFEGDNVPLYNELSAPF